MIFGVFFGLIFRFELSLIEIGCRLMAHANFSCGRWHTGYFLHGGVEGSQQHDEAIFNSTTNDGHNDIKALCVVLTKLVDVLDRLSFLVAVVVGLLVVQLATMYFK